MYTACRCRYGLWLPFIFEQGSNFAAIYHKQNRTYIDNKSYWASKFASHLTEPSEIGPETRNLQPSKEVLSSMLIYIPEKCIQKINSSSIF